VLGVVEKSGVHFSFRGEHLRQGRERAREAVLQARVGEVLHSAVSAALERQERETAEE
jgi:hypothetical protein